MKKQEVIAGLQKRIKAFNQLDKATQRENKSVKKYLQDLKKAAEDGKIEYNSVWHPMYLYALKDDRPQISVNEYREAHGDSVELVEGFHDIQILKGNHYVSLYGNKG